MSHGAYLTVVQRGLNRLRVDIADPKCLFHFSCLLFLLGDAESVLVLGHSEVTLHLLGVCEVLVLIIVLR